MKKWIILGATGSIGTQTLDIVRKYPDEYNVIAFSLGRDLEKNIKLIEEFSPLAVCVRTEETKEILKEKYQNLIVYYGDEGLVNLACFQKEDKEVLLVVSVVGFIGMIPTAKAIEIGRDIALANKETLVVAGEIIMSLAKKHKVNIFPIDSEHSAIHQCLLGENKEDIKKIIITASGGSFRNLSREQLENVSISDALNHPNWKMGAKITIDSSTMMNKGFEVIEAHHLFDVPYEKITTIIHKESIIHSMVEFKDSSIKAQLGNADMHIPILYALSGGKRVEYNNELDLYRAKLSFNEMDFERYPCLKMAYAAAQKGNIFPTILNVSNDAAVNLFLEGKIKYLEIEKIIEEALEEAIEVEELTLDIILSTGRDIQEKIYKKYGRGL